jgi:hypothetical protein
MTAAKERWSMLKNSLATSVSAAMNITGTTVFVPNEISANDWAAILQDLRVEN